MIIMSLMITVYSINKGKNNTVKAEYTNNTMVSYDNIYLSEGTVICVNSDLNKVTVIDCDGEAYQFYGSEDWLVNDKCILLMDDNGTEDIKDDIYIYSPLKYIFQAVKETYKAKNENINLENEESELSMRLKCMDSFLFTKKQLEE